MAIIAVSSQKVIQKAKFAEHGLKYDFVQDNHSLSAEAGVLRGLHFQKGEAAQTKLIRVVTGAVLDVVVDIRKGSPTYGQWDGFILSEHNHRQLLVPKGYAHGFVTLTPNVNFLYKCDNYYNAEADGGIAFDDPDLAIDWPIDPSRAIMSEKDHRHPTLKDLKKKIHLLRRNLRIKEKFSYEKHHCYRRCRIHRL